jgi:secondary thiamine-phosphate synthase enzyme
MIKGMNKLVPLQDSYQHLEGNNAAHIKSSLFGVSETLIINNGVAVLGTWQGIYFCEFDGPRQRQVKIKVVGQ